MWTRPGVEERILNHTAAHCFYFLSLEQIGCGGGRRAAAVPRPPVAVCAVCAVRAWCGVRHRYLVDPSAGIRGARTEPIAVVVAEGGARGSCGGGPLLLLVLTRRRCWSRCCLVIESNAASFKLYQVHLCQRDPSTALVLP